MLCNLIFNVDSSNSKIARMEIKYEIFITKGSQKYFRKALVMNMNGKRTSASFPQI